jgi:transcription initiation factor TFIIH subunit 1
MSEAAAQYKKQDGLLSLSAGGAKAVAWKPISGDAAPVTIPLPDITSTHTLV